MRTVVTLLTYWYLKMTLVERLNLKMTKDTLRGSIVPEIQQISSEEYEDGDNEYRLAETGWLTLWASNREAMVTLRYYE